MTITARFPGTCRKCGGRINPGDAIDWDKATRQTSHATCPAKGAARAPSAKPAATQTTPPPPAIERLAARYAGTCAGCGEAIKVGAQIEYHRSERAAYHLACADKAAEPAPHVVAFSARYEGDLPRPGHVFRTRQGKLLIIVRATARRVSQSEVDDQDDFRGGGDPFYELTAYCRDATEAEAAPVVAQEQAQIARATARKRLGEIELLVRQAENHVTGTAEFPPVDGVEPCAVSLSTTVILSVTSTGIWVRDSGYDWYDQWRIPYDADLATEIRALGEATK